MSELTHLDLFSGIGGFSLAFQREGFTTIAFCEIDKYAQKVLVKNFGAVLANAGCQRRETTRSESATNQPGTNFHDQRCSENVSDSNANGHDKAHQDATKPRRDGPQDWLPVRIHSDITKLDGTQFRGVTVLTAGVPCQPASQAGKRRGAADDRWLWPEALRVLREAMPSYAIFENPPGILSLNDGVEFERLLSEMESYGYAVQPIVVPACAVDARHRRDRVWIVANRDDSGLQGRERGELPERADKWIARPSDPFIGTRELLNRTGITRNGSGQLTDSYRWELEPKLGRVATGIPHRVDRLKGLGNAIVPQVAQVFAKAIRLSLESKT